MLVCSITLLPNIHQAFRDLFILFFLEDIVVDDLTDCNASPPPTNPWFIYVEKPEISMSSGLFSKCI